MQSSHRHACVGSLWRFQNTAERVPTGSSKNWTLHLRAGIAETANAEEGLATSRQINSKTSITRSAAECKLLTWCLLSVWTVAIFCHRKNFQNRLFKMWFSVGLNRRTFSEGRKQAAQARKCKWSVNFLERASKNCFPVAYAVRGFFSVRHRSKRKILSDQIEEVIDERKISASLN